jgi:hypothetical protein
VKVCFLSFIFIIGVWGRVWGGEEEVEEEAKTYATNTPKRTSTNNPPFPKNTGTPILVPLTPSLYVPGKLAATDTVLVDVGTGFYVEKVLLSHILHSHYITQTQHNTNTNTHANARAELG